MRQRQGDDVAEIETAADEHLDGDFAIRSPKTSDWQDLHASHGLTSSKVEGLDRVERCSKTEDFADDELTELCIERVRCLRGEEYTPTGNSCNHFSVSRGRELFSWAVTVLISANYYFYTASVFELREFFFVTATVFNFCELFILCGEGNTNAMQFLGLMQAVTQSTTSGLPRQ